MTFSLGWPQFIWFALAVVGIVGEIIKHGQEKTGKHDAVYQTLLTIISGLLLYWGGFFG